MELDEQTKGRVRTKLTQSEIAIYGAIGILALVGLAFGVPVWGLAILAISLSLIYGCAIAPPKLRQRSGENAGPRIAVESKYTVTCDDEKIVVSFEGHPKDSIRWEEIRLVGVRIDDNFLPQPWWWIMGGPKYGCMYPFDAIGWKVAYGEMSRRLAGFDHVAVSKAAVMMSGSVVVWEKTYEVARPNARQTINPMQTRTRR